MIACLLSSTAVASNMNWLTDFTIFSLFCFLYLIYISIETFIQIHLGYTVALLKKMIHCFVTALMSILIDMACLVNIIPA